MATRCAWCGSDPLYQTYHDEEWGQPVHDDRRLFELLILEGAQAGLSWLTVLKKREGYRQETFGSLDAFLWRYVDGIPRQNAWRSIAEVPATTSDSDRLSRDLKARGFTFVGSTICYAFMQAVGMVNDHTIDCFRHPEIAQLSAPPKRFAEDLGVITCRCVLEAGEPVRFVSHSGGEWQMYCHDSRHDFEDEAAMKRELVVVHVTHLVARDATLNDLADLPVDMGAERSHLSGPWTRFEDRDD